MPNQARHSGVSGNSKSGSTALIGGRDFENIDVL